MVSLRPDRPENSSKKVGRVAPRLFVLDVWWYFCYFIGRSSILCLFGNCSGWPGDLVPGPWGSIPGPGREVRLGSGGPKTFYKNIYFYSHPDVRHVFGWVLGPVEAVFMPRIDELPK